MTTIDSTTLDTTPLLDDLTNWLEGIGVAMINRLDGTQLTTLARADWTKSMPILPEVRKCLATSSPSIWQANSVG